MIRTGNISLILKRSFGSHGAAPRTPMIKFLGKRDHKAVDHHDAAPQVKQQQVQPIQSQPITPVPVAAAPAKSGKYQFQPKPRKPHSPNAVEYYEVKGGVWHGRRKLTVDEVEAINTGGYMA
jgi:hypothetical protein